MVAVATIAALGAADLAAVAAASSRCGAAMCGELAGFDSSSICTRLAAVRHPAPAWCGTAARGELGLSWLASTAPSSAVCWPPSGSGRVWDAARGEPTTASPALCWPPSCIRHPAGSGIAARGKLAGFDNSSIFALASGIRLRPRVRRCALGARWLRQLHHLHSASSRPASGRVWAETRGKLAGFESSIICALRAAVRHPAPARCGAAARVKLVGFDSSIT